MKKVPAKKSNVPGSVTQWCRRRGCRGCKRTPKSFDLVKIHGNPSKICENLHQIPENLGKNGAQRGLIWKKWRPTFAESHEDLFSSWSSQKKVCLRKCSHKKWPKTFFGQGWGKFGQKSFAPPKICLLLHLWCHFAMDLLPPFNKIKMWKYQLHPWALYGPLLPPALLLFGFSIHAYPSINSRVFAHPEPLQLVQLNVWEA